MRPLIIIVMGVSGSGKTTIGSRLATALGGRFIEGDLLHPPGNIEKMKRGIPLTDADRAPWLMAIRSRLLEAAAGNEDVVVACSALKESYRAKLGAGLRISWVYLQGPESLIRKRMLRRTGHFMPIELLSGQMAELEAPENAVVVDVAQPPQVIVRQILDGLGLLPGSAPAATSQH